MQPLVIVLGIEFAILLVLFAHLIINLSAIYRLRPTALPRRGGGGGGRRGGLYVRPLAIERLRTWHARRGGGGVDAAGGRLRRPGLATRTLLRLALPRTRRACALRIARLGRRKRPPTTPLRPRPYTMGGGSPGEAAPMVSILVPARNEADQIESCIRSMVEQNYERLEVLVLDDNSSDATAAIVQRIIDGLQPVQKERLQLLHGEPLPQGWVGKNFACYQLAQHARGDYLFFTDADTVYAPQTVAAVIDCMHHFDVSFLTGHPEYQLRNLLECLLVPMLTFKVFTLLPVPLVRLRPEPILATGYGVLLCFWRPAYEAVGGHAAVKGSILEDLSLARIIKEAGYRMALVDAMELVHCHMYDSYADAWEGLSKNSFSFYNYSLIFSLAMILYNLTFFVIPPLIALASLFLSLPHVATQFALGGYILAVLMRILLTVRFIRSQQALMLLLCLLHPLSILLECLVLLNSIWWRYRKTGTVWKGRRYQIS